MKEDFMKLQQQQTATWAILTSMAKNKYDTIKSNIKQTSKARQKISNEMKGYYQQEQNAAPSTPQSTVESIQPKEQEMKHTKNHS